MQIKYILVTISSLALFSTINEILYSTNHWMCDSDELMTSNFMLALHFRAIFKYVFSASFIMLLNGNILSLFFTVCSQLIFLILSGTWASHIVILYAITFDLFLFTLIVNFDKEVCFGQVFKVFTTHFFSRNNDFSQHSRSQVTRYLPKDAWKLDMSLRLRNKPSAMFFLDKKSSRKNANNNHQNGENRLVRIFKAFKRTGQKLLAHSETCSYEDAY
jgi:hypothetical protein